MRAKVLGGIILGIMLSVFVAPAGVVADAPPTTYRAQGGGFFHEYWGNDRVTFGFESWVDIEGGIGGQFQAYNVQEKIVVLGSFNFGLIDPAISQGWLFGPCSVNGEDGYLLEVSFHDSGEKVPNDNEWILIHIYDEGEKIYDWFNALMVGNIIVDQP